MREPHGTPCIPTQLPPSSCFLTALHPSVPKPQGLNSKRTKRAPCSSFGSLVGSRPAIDAALGKPTMAPCAWDPQGGVGVRAGQQIRLFLRSSSLMRMPRDLWAGKWGSGFLESARCPRRSTQRAGPAEAGDGRASHSRRENHTPGQGAWGVHPRPQSGWASPEPLLPTLLGTRLLPPGPAVWGLEERLMGRKPLQTQAKQMTLGR